LPICDCRFEDRPKLEPSKVACRLTLGWGNQSSGSGVSCAPL
jgi:hypothetical protein